MPITYQIVGCTNPKGAEGVEYATNRAVKTGDYDFKQLADDIQFATTATKADIVAVLTAAKEFIKTHLLQGQRIVLSEIGALQANLNSKCFAQSVIPSDSFDPSSFIKGVGIRFRADADLLKYVRTNRSLKRVPSALMS
jgi:predicted histone-like DNA-binding protein